MDKQNTLLSILKTMEVPKRRLTLSQGNLRWLNRNLQIKNKEHTSLPLALKLIAELLS